MQKMNFDKRSMSQYQCTIHFQQNQLNFAYGCKKFNEYQQHRVVLFLNIMGKVTQLHLF